MTEERNTETEVKAEEPQTAPAETSKAEEAEVEVPAKFKDLVEKVEQMTVLELNELVKVLENRFGVSAVAVAAAPAAGGAAGGGDEKSEYDVELTAVGEQKIAVIKAVKEVLGLGLSESKTLVESAPAVLKQGVKKEDAEAWKKKIEEAGGKVTLK